MKNLCLLLAVVCAAVVLAACMDVLFDEDTGGSSSKKARLTAVRLSTGSAGDITDGLFDNGTRSREVNLPDGTQSVTVTVEAEEGAVVICNGGGTPLTLTLESGLTVLTIYVIKEGKSPSTYTLLFSVADNGGGGGIIFAVPFKTVYVTGESIQKENDLAVYVQGENGETGKAAPGDFTVTPAAAFSAVGSQGVTITHTASGLTTGYMVQVAAAESGLSESLLVIPIKNIYTVGQSVNKETDLVVYKQSADGGVVPVAAANFTVSQIGAFTTTGSPTITVTHSTLTAAYTVTVTAASGFTGVLLVVPIKTVYTVGQSIVKETDIVVYKQSTDGGIAPAASADFTVSQAGAFTTAGAQTITVTHTASSLTATYTVTVTAASGFTGVLLAVPIKTVYTLGESVNKAADLVVYRQSTDGVIAPVAAADFTVSQAGAFTSIGSQTVTISHITPTPLTATYTVRVTVGGGGSMSGGPLLVSPSRTDYAVGESVDKASDLSVYLQGTGVAVPVDTGDFTLDPAGAFSTEGSNQPVTVRHTATGLTTTYTVDVSAAAGDVRMYIAGNSSLSSVMITYVNTNTLTLSYVSGGDIAIAGDTYRLYQATRVGAPGAVIRSVTCGTRTHLLGRKDYEKIYLKVNTSNILQLRGSNPSLIGSYAEFRLVSTGSYKQDADIDLLGNGSYLPGAETWTPLLSSGFSGTFDGDGHTIANLKVNVSSGAAGLFVTNNGILKNIHITSGLVENTIYYTTNTGYAAGIAAINNGTISNCSNGAAITTSSYYNGGIAGDSRNGNITGCYNTGALTTSGQNEAGLGGIAGYGSNITGCYNTGTIEARRYAGGIVGWHTTGNIIRCYNNGQVTGGSGDRTPGGIAGRSEGKIIACYNTGTVIGSQAIRIGGISGWSRAGAAIIACYNTGALTGGNVTDSSYTNGGIVGLVENATITACYTTGTVNATGAYRGGIVGYGTGTNTITACYWKNNTTSPPPYGIGRGSSNAGAAPFSSTFIPTGSPEWGTGDGWDGTGAMPSGVWWKPGTTSGTLPKLWFE